MRGSPLLVAGLIGCALDVDVGSQSAAAEELADVALVCQAAPAAGDAPGAVPDCDAVVGGRALGRGGLLGADRLDGGRLLLVTRDLRAVIRDGAGQERVLAAPVIDARVAPDGRRVVWTELPPGTTAYVPGTPGRIVLVDLDAGTRRLVTDDPLASSPFIVPGSDDVLYVSARTGVASLWLARPGRPARQLTNIGQTRVAAGFVPVPGRELRFLRGTRRAAYTASYGGGAERWTVDVDTGEVAR